MRVGVEQEASLRLPGIAKTRLMLMLILVLVLVLM